MDAVGQPRCLFITGPLGAGKTRWLRELIVAKRNQTPTAKFACILAERGTTTLDDLAAQTPHWLTVSPLVLPCICCPGAANLPCIAREMVEASGPDWLIVEVPTITAVGLVAETERQLGWSCLLVAVFPAFDPSRRRKLGSNMPLFGRLFARADAIIRDPDSAAVTIEKLLA